MPIFDAFHNLHLLKSRLGEIYFNNMIFLFSLSLITVFVPIYLLNLGYSLTQVFIFLAVRYLFFGIFSPVAAYFANRVGFKHVILFRIPLDLLYLTLLLTLETTRMNIYLLAALGGSAMVLYWIPFNCLFAKYTKKQKRGIEVAALMTVPRMMRVFGPPIGAVIYVYLGFHTLIVVTGILLFVSTFPLFMTKDIKPHYKLKLMHIFKREHLKFFLCFFCQGVTQCTSVFFWPLFIYLMSSDVLLVGYAEALIAIGMILFTMMVGKASDMMSRKVLIKFGAFMGIVIWLSRVFAISELQFLLLSFFGGLAWVVLIVPVSAITFDQANKERYHEFLIFRELSLSAGRVFIALAAAVVINKFAFTFSASALATLFFFFF